MAVPLTPGTTPTEVADAIAAAVNADTELRELGSQAVSDGDRFSTNGLLTDETDTDPGLTLSSPFDVPALGGMALALLSGPLGAAGLRARWRSAV